MVLFLAQVWGVALLVGEASRCSCQGNTDDTSKRKKNTKKQASVIFLNTKNIHLSVSPGTNTTTHSVKSAGATSTFCTARARMG